MKRKHVLRTIMALMMIFGVISAAGAQGLPGSGWFTSATIQNVGDQTAAVGLEVYGPNGQPYTGNTQIPVGGNKVFLPGAGNTSVTVDVTQPGPLPAGFSGSMVVNATQPVVAIGQVGNNPVGNLGTPGGRASAQFRGSESQASVLAYPVVKNRFGRAGNSKTTIFSIQAAASDVSYVATIRANDGGVYTRNGNITANRSTTLLPADFRNSGGTAMPTGCTDPNVGNCIGSLTVQATGGDIVGAIIETFDDQSPATVAQSTSLFSGAASNKAFCPVVKNAHGANRRFGGLTVQNTGTVATPVTFKVTLNASTQSFSATSPSIAPGKSYTFLGALNNVGGMPAGTFGSVELTATAANASIVAVVSETNFEAAKEAQKSTTYSCAAPDQATTKVAFPVVKEDFGATLAGTGVSIQNVGTVATDVNVSYVCQGRSTVNLTTGSLAPGASATFFDRAQITDASLCAVTATATNGSGKIVGLANESSDKYAGQPNQGTLDTKNYEGFNLP